MYNIETIRKLLKEKYTNEDFVIDKSGVKTVELIGATYKADEEIIFGNLDYAYAQKEVEWYVSQSLNVYDLPKTPSIWRQVCDKNGNINSNYGWCIFSKENGYQYQNCLRSLRKSQSTRQGMMIYTRPSMHTDYNENGMSDFMCTNNVQVIIRDNKLHYILNQRSCDAVFGAKNDLYWARYVHSKLHNDLLEDYPELELGDLIHQVGSLHVYERHFKFLE